MTSNITRVKNLGAKYSKCSDDELSDKIANELNNEKIVGWFQGRMEFGPRALGCRSIIADPRSEKMQKNLNLKIKFRESFRPFAPSVLREDVSDWFEADYDSPYMLLVDDVKKDKRIEMTKEEVSLFGIDKLNIKRSSIPAVTHVDYSARIQTVDKKTNPNKTNQDKQRPARGHQLLTKTSTYQHRPTQTNKCQHRPTPTNKGQHRPTTVNNGQHRPTQNHTGTHRTTQNNAGQHRTTQKNRATRNHKEQQRTTNNNTDQHRTTQNSRALHSSDQDI